MGSCENCNICCKLLNVPELDKPRNKWCAHAVPGQGCGIYSDRPTPCRAWECVWLMSQRTSQPMPEELKPNRTHVVIDLTTDGKHALLHVDPNRPDAINGRAVQAFIRMNLVQGRDVYVWRGEHRSIVRA